MRNTITLSLGLIWSATSAQTYYYVNSISVDPPAPTTADVVTVTVHGDLSNTASIITGTSHSVGVGSVALTINAAQPGIGLDVLTPHDESFVLGQLAAGVYQIGLGGQSIMDLAPAPQHQFIVSDGTAVCDSVVIHSISWQPFTDTALEVYASYPMTMDCLDYPGFVLLQGTDTIAEENVTFFCLPENATHVLGLGTAPIPEGAFDGELHLWSNFYSEHLCSFALNINLCPEGPCSQLLAYVNNFGNALSNALLDWTVMDQNAEVVASGQFHLHDAQQSEYDTLCLPPGEYTLTALSGVPLVGGQLVLGVTSGRLYAIDRSVQLPSGAGGGSLPFTYYGPCIGNGNGIDEHSPSTALQCSVSGNTLEIAVTDGSPLGQYTVMDAAGRCVHSGFASAPLARIGLQSLAPGVYLLHTRSHGTRAFTR